MDTADSRVTPAAGEAMKKADGRENRNDHLGMPRDRESNSNAMTEAVGAAVRQNAADQLREMARQNRVKAVASMRKAREALDLMMSAEILLAKAAEQEKLADEAHRLSGRAQEALWNIAVESARDSV